MKWFNSFVKSVERFNKNHQTLSLYLSILSVLLASATFYLQFNPLGSPKYENLFEDKLTIYQTWGIFSFTQSSHFGNVGDDEGTIHKIIGIVESEDRTFEIKTRAKYVTTSDNIALPFYPRTIYPNGFFDVTIMMYGNTHTGKYTDSISVMIDTINARANRWGDNRLRSETDSMVINFVKPLISKFKKGKYYYYLQVLDNKNKILSENLYYFFASQTQVDLLNNVTKNICSIQFERKNAYGAPTVELMPYINKEMSNYFSGKTDSIKQNYYSTTQIN